MMFAGANISNKSAFLYVIFWKGFSFVTTQPDGDPLQIDLAPHAPAFEALPKIVTAP
jgi:hypothetical protein